MVPMSLLRTVLTSVNTQRRDEVKDYLEESKDGHDAADSQYPCQGTSHHPEQSLLREGFVVLDHQEDDDDDNTSDQTQDSQEQSLASSRTVNLNTSLFYQY